MFLQCIYYAIYFLAGIEYWENGCFWWIHSYLYCQGTMTRFWKVDQIKWTCHDFKLKGKDPVVIAIPILYCYSRCFIFWFCCRHVSCMHNYWLQTTGRTTGNLWPKVHNRCILLMLFSPYLCSWKIFRKILLCPRSDVFHLSKPFK